MQELGELYKKPVSSLMEWNLECFRWTLEKLGWEVTVKSSAEYVAEYPPAHFLDLRGRIRSSSKQIPGIRDLPYQQVFADRYGFIPGLSILDLLFCEGPGAAEVLLRMSR